jgi:hypothetical protein
MSNDNALMILKPQQLKIIIKFWKLNYFKNISSEEKTSNTEVLQISSLEMTDVLFNNLTLSKIVIPLLNSIEEFGTELILFQIIAQSYPL